MTAVHSNSHSDHDGRLDRVRSLRTICERNQPWDVLVIGGGATGVSIALDAAARGLEVLLVEQGDFGQGTSSRSTKLVHGGVRYLRQGNLTLVRDALKEREMLFNNAPELVTSLPFLVPCESVWQRWFYRIGLACYDLLAGHTQFARSRGLSQRQSIERAPTLVPRRARHGVLYHDGQFDDARLIIALARTAATYGATLMNYCPVVHFEPGRRGHSRTVEILDTESGGQHSLVARTIVNATGPFSDRIRRLDDSTVPELVAASQGVHIVLPRKFLPSETAIIVPKTSDGRVIFIIPYLQHVMVGTTDTPLSEPTFEPKARPEEIDFLLETASRYIQPAPTRADILSVFTGIRPLVKGDPSAPTASLSRDHTILVSDSGLVTIIGGKWTTVRKMAEDCVDRVLKELPAKTGPCATRTLKLQYTNRPEELSEKFTRDVVQNEMARTVEDVLARRTRLLFLDARRAIVQAPQVARWMASELGRDDAWCNDQVARFRITAASYLP
jgi:glycerol-3-phosphate dehydrogenase